MKTIGTTEKTRDAYEVLAEALSFMKCAVEATKDMWFNNSSFRKPKVGAAIDGMEIAWKEAKKLAQERMYSNPKYKDVERLAIAMYGIEKEVFYPLMRDLELKHVKGYKFSLTKTEGEQYDEHTGKWVLKNKQS